MEGLAWRLFSFWYVHGEICILTWKSTSVHPNVVFCRFFLMSWKGLSCAQACTLKAKMESLLNFQMLCLWWNLTVFQALISWWILERESRKSPLYGSDFDVHLNAWGLICSVLHSACVLCLEWWKCFSWTYQLPKLWWIFLFVSNREVVDSTVRDILASVIEPLPCFFLYSSTLHPAVLFHHPTVVSCYADHWHDWPLTCCNSRRERWCFIV